MDHFSVWGSTPIELGEGMIWFASNLLIALSYFKIGSSSLRLRQGFAANLWALFILSCGTGHLVMAVFMGFFHQSRMFFHVLVVVDFITAAVSYDAARTEPEIPGYKNEKDFNER